MRAIYVLELTTAIIFGYFEAILKECIGNTLKFLWYNGRNLIYFRYVRGKFWSPFPRDFQNGLSRISWHPSIPSTFTYLLKGPYLRFHCCKKNCYCEISQWALKQLAIGNFEVYLIISSKHSSIEIYFTFQGHL